MNLIKTFEALHSIPEVSFQEIKTTDYIESALKALNIDVVRFPNHTGLAAQIGSGQPVVGIRADMDALWQEVDGKMQANHSCGHDAHMTIGLGVLAALKKEEATLQGTVRCLFQPAEEQGNGSLSVIQTGFADDMEFLFGVHLRPKEELPLGKSAPSIRHGAAVFFEGNIHGDDLHGARPHQGVNAIDVGMMLQQQLNQLRLSPMVPHSIKMTKFIAGGKSPNIIPGTASFSIDARAQTNDELTTLQNLAQQSMDSLGRLYAVKISGSWIDFTPGAEVSKEAEDILAYAIGQTQGTDKLAEPVITPGSDDFHFYTIERPQLKASMLALGADLSPGLHHPKMTFDYSCLQHGVDILTCAVKKVLKPRVLGDY